MVEFPKYTKQLLYSKISNIRECFGLKLWDGPLKMKALCSLFGMEINEFPFATSGLQGMLTIDSDGYGYITLNSSSSQREQNFYCAHEEIHYLLHQHCRKSFQCFDTVKHQQDKFAEWHANEGAAEWLVPYASFIPNLLNRFNPLNPTPDIHLIREDLAEAYFVSEQVIYNRIENLKYEIWQAANGVHIRDIKLLSDFQQKKFNISVVSCNALGAFASTLS